MVDDGRGVRVSTPGKRVTCMRVAVGKPIPSPRCVGATRLEWSVQESEKAREDERELGKKEKRERNKPEERGIFSLVELFAHGTNLTNRRERCGRVRRWGHRPPTFIIKKMKVR